MSGLEFGFVNRDSSLDRITQKFLFLSDKEAYNDYFDFTARRILSLCDATVFYNKAHDDNIIDESILSTFSAIVFIANVNFLNNFKNSVSLIKTACKNGILTIPVLPDENDEGLLNQTVKNTNALKLVDNTKINYDFDLAFEACINNALIRANVEELLLEEFTPQIFISYRKKDFKSVLKLISNIHNLPNCEDIPVWYDKYLPLGDDFEKQIDSKIESCGIFLIHATENICEEGNYVLNHEYVYAQSCELKKIISVNSKKLNTALFSDLYGNVSQSFDINKDSEELANYILKNVNNKHKSDPETHSFLLGAAYFFGMGGFEQNYKKSFNLLSGISEKSEYYCEAQRGLAIMYKNGFYVEKDLIKYAKIIFGISEKLESENDYKLSTYELINVASFISKNATEQKENDFAEVLYKRAQNTSKQIKDKYYSAVYHAKASDGLARIYIKYLGRSKKCLEICQSEIKALKKVIKHKKEYGEAHDALIELYETLYLYQHYCFESKKAINTVSELLGLVESFEKLEQVNRYRLKNTKKTCCSNLREMYADLYTLSKSDEYFDKAKEYGIKAMDLSYELYEYMNQEHFSDLADSIIFYKLVLDRKSLKSDDIIEKYNEIIEKHEKQNKRANLKVLKNLSYKKEAENIKRIVGNKERCISKMSDDYFDGEYHNFIEQYIDVLYKGNRNSYNENALNIIEKCRKYFCHLLEKYPSTEYALQIKFSLSLLLTNVALNLHIQKYKDKDLIETYIFDSVNYLRTIVNFDKEFYPLLQSKAHIALMIFDDCKKTEEFRNAKNITRVYNFVDFSCKSKTPKMDYLETLIDAKNIYLFSHTEKIYLRLYLQLLRSMLADVDGLIYNIDEDLSPETKAKLINNFAYLLSINKKNLSNRAGKKAKTLLKKKLIEDYFKKKNDTESIERIESITQD